MGTVATALAALDLVAAHQPVGVTELARRLDVPKSTAQRALQSLATAGWIRAGGPSGRAWVLTSKPVDLARRVVPDAGLREMARDAMSDLRDQTGESVHLAVRDHNEVVIIDLVETAHPIRINVPLGTRSPLHATATGKTLLAHLDAHTRDELIAEGLPRFTDATITDRDELCAELDAIRSGRRLAIAHRELRDDIASVAVAVLTPAGAPLCALSVFIPSYRFLADAVESISTNLVAAARRIESRAA